MKASLLVKYNLTKKYTSWQNDVKITLRSSNQLNCRYVHLFHIQIILKLLILNFANKKYLCGTTEIPRKKAGKLKLQDYLNNSGNNRFAQVGCCYFANKSFSYLVPINIFTCVKGLVKVRIRSSCWRKLSQFLETAVETIYIYYLRKKKEFC